MSSHRFKIDEIVHPDSMDLAKSFTCAICYGLVDVDEPVQTVCNHIYCGPCLAPCAGGPCPTCRTMLPPGQSGTPLRECNQVVLRSLGGIEIEIVGDCYKNRKPELDSTAICRKPQLQQSLMLRVVVRTFFSCSDKGLREWDLGWENLRI